MVAVQDLASGSVQEHVIVGRHRMEELTDPPSCHSAEDVGELARPSGGWIAFPRQHLGASDRGRHREQLRADVHAAEEQRLLALQAGAVTHHLVEEGARQLPRCPVDEAKVSGELLELRVARPPAPAKPLGGIPDGVGEGDPRQTGELLPEREVPLDQLSGQLEVPVHRLPRDEQAHDLARALEDPVDPEVAQHAFDRDRRLAPGRQRVRSLVAASTAHLQRLVHEPPAHFGVEELGDRRLEPDVVSTPVDEEGHELRHGLHREGVDGDVADHVGDGLVLADGLPPLDALGCPLPHDPQRGLARADGHGRNRQATRVEGDEGQLESASFLEQKILTRNADVPEADDAVLDAADPHEVQSVDDLDARPIHLDDERGDLSRVRVPGHDHDDLGHRPVRAPELLAVEDVVSVLRALDGRGQAGRVGADIVLGEGERGDRARCQPRQILLLLFLRAEELQWLRNADGLMSREERYETSVDAADNRQDPAVLALIEAEAAVLASDLEAERPHLPQAVHDVWRNLALPIDSLRIDLGAQELPHLIDIGARPLADVLVRIRVGVDEVQTEVSEEEVSDERRVAPLGLARGFRDPAGLRLAYVPRSGLDRASGRGSISVARITI